MKNSLSSIQVTFWGAARTVTGSMHLVEVNGHRLLLNCGLYQGQALAKSLVAKGFKEVVIADRGESV